LNALYFTNTESLQKIKLEATQLIRFYQHPSRYFAQQTLSLYLDNQLESLNDDEPFDCNHLTSYVFKQQVLDVLLSSKLLTPDKQGNVENLLSDVKKAAKVSGKFPDLPHNEELINKLASDSEKLADYMDVCEIECVQSYDLTIKLPIKADLNDQVGKQADNIVTSECELTVRIQVANDKLINYRTSQPKSKDFVQQYLHLLVLQLWLEQHSISTDNEIYHHLSKVTASHGFYFDTKAQKAVHYVYEIQHNVQSSLTLLIECFLIGQKQALLLNGDLAEKYYKTKGFDQQAFELYWYDANNDFSLGKDPYIHYFWPAPPLFAEILPAIEKIFASIVSERTKVKVL